MLEIIAEVLPIGGLEWDLVETKHKHNLPDKFQSKENIKKNQSSEGYKAWHRYGLCPRQSRQGKICLARYTCQNGRWWSRLQWWWRRNERAKSARKDKEKDKDKDYVDNDDDDDEELSKVSPMPGEFDDVSDSEFISSMKKAAS
jgi:hypothetical protein